MLYIPFLRQQELLQYQHVLLQLQLHHNSYYSPYGINTKLFTSLVSKLIVPFLSFSDAYISLYLFNTFIDFSATEFAIVEFLAKNVGQVFSRQQIINAVKGSDYPVTARAIDVQILGIRKKLEQFNTSDINVSDLICTIRGIGYRMKEDKNSVV